MALTAASAPDGVSIEPEPTSEDQERLMPLTDHLVELRSRVMWSIGAIVVGSIVGFIASERIIEILLAPVPEDVPVVTMSPTEAFSIRLRISIVVGVILTMPVLLFHIWRFVSPGLTPNERRIVLPWIPAALIFFAVGVAIAYVVMPFALGFLLSFSTDELQTLLQADLYLGFVTTLFLTFGLMMEFPIILYGLSLVGIATSERLARSRRMAILGIAIFAAAATPGGDLVAPGVLGLTMYVLYEGTLQVVKRQGR